MLEARIISPRGSLYIAAEATPYDVQQLRSHVLALWTPNASDVRVTLRLGPNSRARVGALVTSLATKLAEEGVCVTVDDKPVRRHTEPPREVFACTPKRGGRRSPRHARSCVV